MESLNTSHRHLLTLITCAALGASLMGAAFIILRDPLGIALWSVVAAIVCLPLVYIETRLDARLASDRYIAACGAIVFSLIFVGLQPVMILAAVAWSLIGGVQLLRTFRLPAALAIAATMLGAVASFTWPIWMAGILATHDLGPWLQRMIDVSPAFALNAAISPEDPLTHRPLAYKLMNLGQDVNYAMPRSAAPCMMLHAGMGVIGFAFWKWSLIQAARRAKK